MAANEQRKRQQTNKENGSKRTKKTAANEQSSVFLGSPRTSCVLRHNRSARSCGFVAL